MFGSGIVLIVDDDDDDVEIMSAVVKKLSKNCRIQRVVNGQEALTLLQDLQPVKPSQIILDINMPVMDGLTFLELLRSNFRLKDIPVFVFTTSSRITDKERVEALGAHYYVKPSTDFQWESYFNEIIKIEKERVKRPKK